MREALYYIKHKEAMVECTLCPHRCMISNGKTGLCRVRQNNNGTLYALTYGKITDLSVDPIEKKPLHKWRPGTEILSFGSYGCNMTCLFCQNYVISQGTPILLNQSPADIVKATMDHGLTAIAYTYNEPTVFYEMVLETAKLAREQGIANVLVTNGFINQEPLKALLPFIDAMNVDVKSYDAKQYRAICGGDLQPVLETIKTASLAGVHVEITCLLVPGLFDDLIEVDRFFKFFKEEIGDFYLHLSRYFPRYRASDPATDISKMMEIQYIAKKYFANVKLGNVY